MTDEGMAKEKKKKKLAAILYVSLLERLNFGWQILVSVDALQEMGLHQSPIEDTVV